MLHLLMFSTHIIGRVAYTELYLVVLHYSWHMLACVQCSTVNWPRVACIR